ncbi:hypothetical protein [Kitasatospora paracochleata]|uniref:GDSL-like lipase/acylhydrolase family protein n=1 Tax=Kitasatospora paracochleata TaxID=58354 RepID=A0ABT1J4C4_9ACTN|nr:hypothetical protein [Kitasatospora paracochleata]MCP2312277.1 hypothetical protein [Kitasatospora paracochleata]
MKLRRAATAFALVAASAAVAVAPQTATAAANCSYTFSNQTPLVDLGSATYQGQSGGLYPGASNTRPAAHTQAGKDIALNHVLPRNAAGQVDLVNGKVVLISIGMSNTTQEFQAFIAKARQYPNLNTHLVIVDGAQGGQDAHAWADPANATWSVLANRLATAGVTAAQVQAVWIKEQYIGDNLGAFPAGAQSLRDTLATIARNARAKYANLALGYVASRIYTYDSTRSAGAYQQGFAVKWLIEQQINGDPTLSYGAGGVAPWLSWGPYMWADGLGSDGVAGGIPGRSDGLEWKCSDLESDGVHPGPTGEQKVANMLLNQFSTDETTVSWFTK